MVGEINKDMSSKYLKSASNWDFSPIPIRNAFAGNSQYNSKKTHVIKLIRNMACAFRLVPVLDHKSLDFLLEPFRCPAHLTVYASSWSTKSYNLHLSIRSFAFKLKVHIIDNRWIELGVCLLTEYRYCFAKLPDLIPHHLLNWVIRPILPVNFWLPLNTSTGFFYPWEEEK